MLTGKTVLVTGGTGSIGSEIVRQVLRQQPDVVRVYSRDESKQFELQHALSEFGLKVRFLIGDIRDFERLRYALDGVDVVFHAGALKHVPSCEFNPFEAVKTNIVGTQNVVEAALRENVEKVIAISTDKAVNPTNTMGATKLLAEKLVSSANLYKGARRTAFSCVRFGNVMGSRGSVIPLFVQQALHGQPVTVTDPGMKRFMMTIPSAVQLVLEAGEIAEGGETFIFRMPTVRISDVAHEVVNLVSEFTGFPPTQVDVTGIRPGEKLKENLIGEEEMLRSSLLGNMFVLKPEWASQSYSWEERAVPTDSLGLSTYDTDSDAVCSRHEVRQLIMPTVKSILTQYFIQRDAVSV